MAPARSTIDVYLEIGSKRTFAGAVEWPGWCRSGRDTGAALERLFEYGARYARVVRGTRLGFAAPKDVSSLAVVERLKGDATTDFGAPSMSPKGDRGPIPDGELRRLRAILKACWRAFDDAVEAARGKQLAKGPRGGGRNLTKIVEHVVGAEAGYLRMLARKVEPGPNATALDRTRATVLESLDTTAPTGAPPLGPRGGKRWEPRYFVRRVAWHVLDHAWEIEDRVR